MFTGADGNRADLDHRYMDMLEDIPVRPIFIIGDHRTGTTILYQILGATGCFNVVTAYHIIKYDQILYDHINQRAKASKGELAALFHQKGLHDRGFDGVSVSPDTPEEYGFILKNAGYRPQLRPDNTADLMDLCRKVQLTSGSTRLLLLKNPWDCLNFMYVREVFSDSKFIFVHRHPLNTINSQLKTTRSLFGVKNEYVALVAGWYEQIFQRPLRLQAARLMVSSRFGIGLRIVTRHVAKAAEYFLRHIPSLPQHDYVDIRYEDLCRTPRATVSKVLDSLGLTEGTAVEYESLISIRTGALLSEVSKNREAICRKMKPYLEYCGYTLHDVSG